LRELHLKTPFGGARAPREDIEDQLGAVDDLYAGGAFQIALLCGREFVIDNQKAGMERLGEFFQFLDLAVSEERGRIRDGTHLKNFGGDFRASARGEFSKLAKGFRRSRGRCAPAFFKACKDRPFGGLLE
jgi:hypothetical protein